MKLDLVKRDVSSSGVMQVAQAKVKATKKVFDMFSDHTYTNKPLAILRELVANGVDAHVMAGHSDRPIEVQLPTEFDPTCVIRDFGTGMSHDFVMSDFMEYTNGSTKDQSDDQIGGWGIGSKSPFAYVDQYTLRVVHDGILSVYTMFKDEDGIPAIGLQGQTTTDEPNGVEVSFPVEDKDMAAFAVAAQDALQFFRPLPIVTNGTLTPPDYLYTGTDWAIRQKAGPLGIILGGVRYPVVTHSLDYVTLRANARLKPLLEYGLDLTLPLGACTVAMSREGLSYTTKTNEGIVKALEAVIDNVVATFATIFDNAPSEWDAMMMLAKESGKADGISNARAQLMTANAQYKGRKLETSFRITSDELKASGLSAWDSKHWVVEPVRSRRSSNCPPPQWRPLDELYGIEPYAYETVIIDDLPQNPKSKTVQRLRQFISDQPQAKKTLVVRGPDEKAVRQLVALLRGPTQFILTSSLPEPVKASKSGGKNANRPRVRMFTFNGTLDRFTQRDITNLTPSDSKRNAVAEVPYPAQPATGIMVVMNSFDLPTDFHKKMGTGLVRFDELHFVNAADAPKIKATFVNFEEVFAERLAKALAQHPELPQRLALSWDSDIMAYRESFEAINRDRRYDALPAAAKQRPFGRLFEAWRTYIKPLRDDQRKLAPFVTVAKPAGVDPEALIAAMEEKQEEACVILKNLEMDNETHRGILFKFL